MVQTLEELQKELTNINQQIGDEISSSLSYDGTGREYDRTKLNSLEQQKFIIVEKIEREKARLTPETETARLKAKKETETARLKAAEEAEAARPKAAEEEAARRQAENKVFEKMETMGKNLKKSIADKEITKKIESDARKKSIQMIKDGLNLQQPEVYSDWPKTWYTYAVLMHHFYDGAGQVTIVRKLLKDMLEEYQKDMLEEYQKDNAKYSELIIAQEEQEKLKKLGGKKSKKYRKKSKKHRKKSRKSRKSKKSRKGRFPHKKSRRKRR